jgi:hypothetical protein
MFSVQKSVVITLLVSLFASDTDAICKWVDENGVVHYAETCPDNTQSTDVPIIEPPSRKQVEEANRNAEKVRNEVKSHSETLEQEREQQAGESLADVETTNANIEKCAEARWRLAILSKQLPVYYDEDNSLHFNRSLHHYWYTGNRNYLDDAQRQAEVLRYTSVEKEACTDTEADIRARIMKYQEKSQKDMCGHLENKLATLRKDSTGIPSDEMRELEDLLKTRCN